MPKQSLRDRFLTSGWTVEEVVDRPRVITIYSYKKKHVVITLQQHGQTDTEWEVSVTYTDAPPRVFKVGGTPAQALAQALSLTIGYMSKAPQLPGVKTTLIRLMAALPKKLED